MFADEYEVDSWGGVWVSKKGSLGALGRFVWVVDAIGGALPARVRAETSAGRGLDWDRE